MDPSISSNGEARPSSIWSPASTVPILRFTLRHSKLPEGRTDIGSGQHPQIAKRVRFGVNIFLYRDELGCADESLADEVLLTVTLVALKPESLGEPWCDARIIDDGFVRRGGRGTLEALNEGHRVEHQGATLLMRPAASMDRPAQLPRNLHGYRIVEQSYEYVDDIVGRPLNAPLVGAGNDEGGPWLIIEGDGVMTFQTPIMSFDAHLREDENGVSALVLGHACRYTASARCALRRRASGVERVS